VARDQLTAQLRALDLRRRKLGMSRATVARRAGLSSKTVERILSGRVATAAFANVAALASVLGVELKFVPLCGVGELRERQARHKAERLVQMVQATSGLEGQGLDPETLNEMVNQTAHELLAGSKGKLWKE
jgi:transcriptional regulator with XRE-family HTH domain